MEKQNITLALPKDILHKVKVLAVTRNESVSSLLTKVLETLVSQEEAYGQAREESLRLLQEGFDLGTKGSWACSREALHER